MGKKVNVLNRIIKINDKLNATNINNKWLIFIKDVGDADYYFVDNEGNKQPKEQVLSNSNNTRLNIINIKVVDNN